MLTVNNYFQGLFLKRKIGKLILVYCFFQILGMARISFMAYNLLSSDWILINLTSGVTG